MIEKPIYVTQPSLPPLHDYVSLLEQIWNSKVLSNCGPMHQELESKLAEYLGVKHVSLFNNCTNALMVALRALDFSGEIITTPYSFVATSHSILWNGLKPVFVDINPITLNLDPDKIEGAITSKTVGIMPVHCYGNTCDVDAISHIAKKYKLKVIYDAAHAFAVKNKGGSILRHGDLSVLSFHATKVFNTFEGGAIICEDDSLKKRIDSLRNFGIKSETEVTDLGMNGKMSEVNAAFGLLQLKHVDQAIIKRKSISEIYTSELSKVKGIRVLKFSNDLELNYSYFPILVEPEYPLTRDQLYQKLKNIHIYSRRYFYPLISNLPMYAAFPSSSSENLPVANEVAEKILCLPIYSDLEKEDLLRVVECLKNNLFL